MDKKLVRGISRPIGMTAGYALQVVQDLQYYSRTEDGPEVTWLTLKDGSHPTIKEAIEWLRTLDYNFDIVNGES